MTANLKGIRCIQAFVVILTSVVIMLAIAILLRQGREELRAMAPVVQVATGEEVQEVFGVGGCLVTNTLNCPGKIDCTDNLCTQEEDTSWVCPDSSLGFQSTNNTYHTVTEVGLIQSADDYSVTNPRVNCGTFMTCPSGSGVCLLNTETNQTVCPPSLVFGSALQVADTTSAGQCRFAQNVGPEQLILIAQINGVGFNPFQ